MPKFQFFYFGGGVQFFLGGGVTLESELKKCLNLNFRGGGLSSLKFQRGALWRIWTQILLFEVTVHKPAVHHR